MTILSCLHEKMYLFYISLLIIILNNLNIIVFVTSYALSDDKIYFPDQLEDTRNKWKTSTTTSKSTFGDPEEKSPEEQERLRKRADEICSRKFNKPKPDSSWGKRKSELKCANYRYLFEEMEFIEQNKKDCKRARMDAGDFFVVVIEGDLAGPGEFPHMAAIGWQSLNGGYLFKCGGSLISERYVLTAAHCLIVSNRDTSVASQQPVIVRLGDQNILDHVYDGLTPVEFNITRSIRHPMYKAPSKYYDIALLQLSGDVLFDKHVRPACLWSKDTFESYRKAIVTGWGVTSVGGLETSPDLLKASVDLIDTSLCERILKPYWNRHWKGFANHQMCAGVLAGGPDTCQGDSGGPIQIKETAKPMYHVMGVTSFGYQCGREGVPAIYSRVSAFLDWLEPIVWPGV